MHKIRTNQQLFKIFTRKKQNILQNKLYLCINIKVYNNK